MKLRKLPKRPSINASLKTWKNYEVKCKKVEEYNKNIKLINRNRGFGNASCSVTVPPKKTPPSLSNAKKLK